MWIRDSSVQLGIYLPRIDRHPALRYVVEGGIRTQAYFILQVGAGSGQGAAGQGRMHCHYLSTARGEWLLLSASLLVSRATPPGSLTGAV